VSDFRPPGRHHLRLVGEARREHGNDPEFEPIDRDVHDLHGPYHELRDDGNIHFAAGESEDDATVDTEAAAPSDPSALSPRFVVVALIAFQLLVALSYAGKYVALTRGGDVYAVAALLTVPASLCLYIGALMLALRPGRGRALFVVAAVGLGLSLPAWGVSYGWTWPMAFGSMLGLAGAWYARAELRPDEASAAQP
jgi:hypothetical protein